MLSLLVLTFGLAHSEDLFREREAVENRIAGERYRAMVNRRYASTMAGLAKIAGPQGLDHARSKCTMNYRDNEQQVGQLCDARGCVPIFGKGSEGWSGYTFSACNLQLVNGSQCFASTGTVDSQPVVSVECTRPNLDQVQYLINQDTGRMKQTGFSKSPR